MKRFTEVFAVLLIAACGMLTLAGCEAQATVVEPIEGPDPADIDEKAYEDEMKKLAAQKDDG